MKWKNNEQLSGTLLRQAHLLCYSPPPIDNELKEKDVDKSIKPDTLSF